MSKKEGQKVSKVSDFVVAHTGPSLPLAEKTDVVRTPTNTMSTIAAAMGQLPRFDGRSPDPKVWLSQATRAMRCFLANTTDVQKLDYLLMHLTDSAYVWAESKNFTTVSGFEQAFQSRFVWESTATVMHKLATLKQEKGQTVTELADEVRQLAAYVKDYPVAMMVRIFIEGLEDPGLREKVLGGRPVSLEAAEEAAKYFVTYAQPKEIEKEEKKVEVKEESDVDKITKQLEKLAMQLTQMQQGRGAGILPRPGGGGGGGFKCYQCGKEGHMARDCTQKGRQAMNVMQQIMEKTKPTMTIAEFLNGEEDGVEMLVGERKRHAIRDPEGWGIEEARDELRKKLAEGGEEAKGSRFVRGKARISSLPTSYNVVDQLKLTPVSASVWNYIKDSDKVRKELLEALKKGDEEKEDGAAAMQGVAKVVAAAPVEAKGKEKEPPRASNLIFQIPQCDVYLGKHRVTAIVDSGASQTALSHVIARKLGLLPYIQDTTIEFTTSSGETSKPWGILPDVPVRVGKLTLPVDIAVTGANTYDMLLGQDWIYSANADILTSKGKIVYQVNTTETDSVPITTGPLGVTRPSFVLLPSRTVHRNINEEDEERIREWMEEQDFLNWMEERRIAMEEGRVELNTEEEDEYYLWLREQEEEEEEEKEEASSEEESEEEEEEKEIKEARGEEEETWGHDFGSPTADEMGAWDTMGLGIDWDKEYDEMVEKYVEDVNEAKWEGDSMVDGEEYLDQGVEEWELIYDKKRKRISPNHLFELFNYPAAERWNYLAAEKGDEGRIILGSYYTLKKEAPRVACPAFEDLPVSLNHELGEQQQKEVRTLLVEYRDIFSTEKETLGTHPTIRHHISTGNAKPIAHKPYRVSPSERARIEEEDEEEGESSESVTQGEKGKDGEEEESTEEDEKENGEGEEEDSKDEEEGEDDGSKEEEGDKEGEVEEDSSEEEEGEEVGEEEDSGDYEEGQRPDDGVDEQLLEELGQPKKKARVDGDEEEGEEGTPSKNPASETLDIWDDTNTLFFLEKGAVDPAWNSVEKRREGGEEGYHRIPSWVGAFGGAEDHGPGQEAE
ncbi:unnamed protein product [Closterium sp. Yama58-4]|nr:unnamed protein product [Closterium sp. Yama58-4]